MFLWIVSMVIPALMIVLGRLSEKVLRTRNYVAGFRTPRSMKTQETWDYANRLGGRWMMRLGIVAAVLCALFNWLLPLPAYDVLLIDEMAVGLPLVIAVIPIVETGLKRNFDEDGRPRK